MKRIVILGSAGSIGENAVRVAEQLPDRLKVVGLAVNRNDERVLAQAARLGVAQVAVADPAAAARAAARAPAGVTVLPGAAGLASLAALPEADIVLCAVVGIAGLAPVIAALGAGHDVALATKEVMVVAGHLVSALAARTGARLLPVDSEHSAVFQCLQGERAAPRRIVLTASGGPFLDRPDVDFETVGPREALNHPRWDMGRKVTIDSATLMNKGLEIMEAQWLFGMPLDRIDVLIHPESIVHSLVEFQDGNVMAQLSVPDMRFAIQYALTWPERRDGGLPPLDLARIGRLTFRPPDLARFPCLGLARAAAQAGGTLPAVLNAANEVAVEAFLEGRLPFAGIWRLVERVMRAHTIVPEPDLAAIVAADQWARRHARATDDAQAG